MLRSALTFAVVVAANTLVDAMPTFVAKIPNGDNVPDVAALGHVNPDGGGANNQFGLDFDSAGYEWTATFCQTDSDGDGQTNGQELGDPCCEWDEDDNAVVLWTEGVSHPGDASLMSDESLWANVTCGSSTNSTNAVADDDDADGVDDIDEYDDDDDFNGTSATNSTISTNTTTNGGTNSNSNSDAVNDDDDDDDDTSVASAATISTAVLVSGLTAAMALLA